MSWRRPLRTFTFRLTLTYMALFSGSVGLMLGASYVAGVWRPLRAAEAQILGESERLRAVFAAQGRNALLRALQQRTAAAALGGAKERYPYHVLVAPNGAVVSANLAEWPRVRRDEWLRYEFGTYASGAEEEHEAVVRDLALPGGYRLLTGLDTEDLDEREDLIVEAVLWGAMLTLVLGLAGGVLMTWAVSQRLDSINRAARAVIAGDLSGRVRLRGSGDDFDQLAETLNEMLARIETLVASISRVSDSIAHELRTPLARLQAELEDLAGASDPAEAEARKLAALDEAARLQGMFEALLRLARLESGRGGEFRPLDLSGLLEDAVEFHGVAAEEKGQRLTAQITPALMVRGSRDLLFQAVSNLLDNAVKFTPPGGRIRLDAAPVGGGVEVAVSDDGPGVPAAERPRVLERLYRVAGTERVEGFGLGLALVTAVAQQHGAKVRLEDAGRGPGTGLRVVLTIPGRISA